MKGFTVVVELLQSTGLIPCAKAIRKCWASEDKSDNGGVKDRELIDRVGNKNKHSSTLEHLVYTFDIDGISRACLQELARHRMASLSVKSTRYTLKELKLSYHFKDKDFNEASKFVVFTGNLDVDICIIDQLARLQELVQKNISNDIVKYALPEAYKTSLVYTINARSLRNFLGLRTSKHALKEIRTLAYNMYHALPEDHKYLFEDIINAN